MSKTKGAAPSFGMQRQLEIYLAAERNEKPPRPVLVERLRERARRALGREAWDYLDGGAGGGDTMRANRDALFRYRIVPRMLRGVHHPDASVKLFGRTLRAPVLLAPIGVQGILHPDGEVAVARAASGMGIPIVLSTVSSNTLEEVAVIRREEDGPFEVVRTIPLTRPL